MTGEYWNYLIPSQNGKTVLGRRHVRVLAVHLGAGVGHDRYVGSGLRGIEPFQAAVFPSGDSSGTPTFRGISQPPGTDLLIVKKQELQQRWS